MSLNTKQLILSIGIVLLTATLQAVRADDTTDTATTEDATESTESSGKISVEFTIDEGIPNDDDDDEVVVIVKRDGVELSDEEKDAELEEWEEEVIGVLEDTFRGKPRKGIFALQQDRDSGFFEAGFGLATSNAETMMRDGFEGLEFVGELNVGLQVSGLFYEYFSASPNRGIWGVNFFNSDWVGIDLITGLEHEKFADDKEDALLLPISVRHADWTAGLRSTVYLGPLVLQGQVRKEVSSFHQGYSASVQAGTHVQFKNLNLHSVVGASYQSEEVMDYYYGVTASETSADFSQYDPGEDITYNAEIGASYPMSEDWVLRGQVNYTKYSEALVNSPFWNSDEDEHISSRIMLMMVL